MTRTEAMHVTVRARAFVEEQRERDVIVDADDDALTYHLAMLLKRERQAAARGAIEALRVIQSLAAEGVPPDRFGSRMHEIMSLARTARHEVEEGERPFQGDGFGAPVRGKPKAG